MKIVINKCYGGFNLSIEATMAYAKRKGFELFAYNIFEEVYVETIDDEDYPAYSKCKATCEKEMDWFTPRNISRYDADLIAVVEELGKKAGGLHSRLAVIEIPDRIDWYIDENDGLESIHETHRIWD